MLRLAACTLALGFAPVAAGAPGDAAWDRAASFACLAQSCSTLIPAASVDDPDDDDCAYRNGNEWWLDYVAGSLAWSRRPSRHPITVAVFDDGAAIDHPQLRNRLWTNEAEARGRPGVDDDGNGYIDDVHGWDFVDNRPIAAPQGECRSAPSHGTFMASLIAAERNNGIGIAAAGSDGARVMVLRIVGCGGDARVDPGRLTRALQYATRMGARILSFSAHWDVSTPELDAAFADIADRPDSPRAAIVVASVPNKGEPQAGYPAAYRFRRIVRAVPIGDADRISPGTSAVPDGLNFGSPSACIIGATAGPAGFAIASGSSNSTAILAGLLAGIWASPPYWKLSTDEFLARVVRGRMAQTPRRSGPGLRAPYLSGVPLADACTLATGERSARVCRPPGREHEEPQ
ncbi:MAG TPA: S8 family serine peptidase [Steroidobacteraceae bacterium]|jgi:subtilisin family serine protease|nr:S8 family serine peptidase [Steroidobacteraceae bacterium]